MAMTLLTTSNWSILGSTFYLSTSINSQLPLSSYSPHATSTNGNIAHHVNTTEAPEVAHSPFLEPRAGERKTCPATWCYDNKKCKAVKGCDHCYVGPPGWYGVCTNGK